MTRMATSWLYASGQVAVHCHVCLDSCDMCSDCWTCGHMVQRHSSEAQRVAASHITQKINMIGTLLSQLVTSLPPPPRSSFVGHDEVECVVVKAYNVDL